jgi:hypothetical protein
MRRSGGGQQYRLSVEAIVLIDPGADQLIERTSIQSRILSSEASAQQGHHLVPDAEHLGQLLLGGLLGIQRNLQELRGFPAELLEPGGSTGGPGGRQRGRGRECRQAEDRSRHKLILPLSRGKHKGPYATTGARPRSGISTRWGSIEWDTPATSGGGSVGGMSTGSARILAYLSSMTFKLDYAS